MSRKILHLLIIMVVLGSARLALGQQAIFLVRHAEQWLPSMSMTLLSLRSGIGAPTLWPRC